MSNRKNNSKAISSTSNDAILEMAKGLHWLADPTFKWNLYVEGGQQNLVKYAHRIVAALLSEDEELFEFFTAPSEAAPVWEPKERGERRRTKAQLKAVLGTSSSKIQLSRLGMIKAFYEGLRSAGMGQAELGWENWEKWLPQEGEAIILLAVEKKEKLPSDIPQSEEGLLFDMLGEAWDLGFNSLAEVQKRSQAIKDSWKATKAKPKAKAAPKKTATKKVATKKAEPKAKAAPKVSTSDTQLAEIVASQQQMLLMQQQMLAKLQKDLSWMSSRQEMLLETVTEPAAKKAEPKAKAKKTASKKQTRQQLELAALEMAATQKAASKKQKVTPTVIRRKKA